MKNKFIIISGIVLISTFAYFAYSQKLNNPTTQLTVEPIGDGKGVFIGQQRAQHNEGNPNEWSPEAKKRVEDHERDIRGIEEGSKQIQLGDTLLKQGRYREALEAYQKAYENDPLSRSYIGASMLIPTYEALGRYDDALALLDKIESKYYKSEYGHKQASEIRARLLAAKNKSN